MNGPTGPLDAMEARAVRFHESGQIPPALPETVGHPTGVDIAIEYRRGIDSDAWLQGEDGIRWVCKTTNDIKIVRTPEEIMSPATLLPVTAAWGYTPYLAWLHLREKINRQGKVTDIISVGGTPTPRQYERARRRMLRERGLFPSILTDSLVGMGRDA